MGTWEGAFLLEQRLPQGASPGAGRVDGSLRSGDVKDLVDEVTSQRGLRGLA